MGRYVCISNSNFRYLEFNFQIYENTFQVSGITLQIKLTGIHVILHAGRYRVKGAQHRGSFRCRYAGTATAGNAPSLGSGIIFELITAHKFKH